jgi:hypothetical protein
MDLDRQRHASVSQAAGDAVIEQAFSFNAGQDENEPAIDALG